MQEDYLKVTIRNLLNVCLLPLSFMLKWWWKTWKCIFKYKTIRKVNRYQEMLLFCGEQKHEIDSLLVEWLNSSTSLKRALYQQHILTHNKYLSSILSIYLMCHKIWKWHLQNLNPLSKQTLEFVLLFISLTSLVIYLHISSCAWATTLHQMGWLQSLFSPVKKLWFRLNSTQKKSKFNNILSCMYLGILSSFLQYFCLHFA